MGSVSYTHLDVYKRQEYDSLNRLTKETNLAIGSEWRYTYDNGGNITKKEEYNPATGALRSSWNYGYGDTYWNCLLYTSTTA